MPKNHISFCLDHHIRDVLRPEFIDIWIKERQGSYRGIHKYYAYAELINEDVKTVIDVVYDRRDPTQVILDHMNLCLTSIPREVEGEKDLTVTDHYYIKKPTD